MQVVLREDVDNVGDSGTVVRVRPGFARNYLIPRGLAVVASKGNIKQVEHEKRGAIARSEKIRAAAKTEAEKLNGVSVKVEKAAGEEGKLYGSVTAQDVATALKAQLDVDVDRRKIKLPEEAIKTVGSHPVSVKLASEVSAHFVVQVVAEA
ncbi:MAG: 50S ribosomal protein L9 [Myxococcales bacterium]|nr:50S ribosomal protein L9 [Myxococcales bacterium]